MAGYNFAKEACGNEAESLFSLPAKVGLSEATVDLGALFAEDVLTTGSFDLRRFKARSMAKLIEAIPIPTFLVDESCRIAFANRASSKLLPKHVDAVGKRFSQLFSNPQDGENSELLIEAVLTRRIPLEVEGFLGLTPHRLFCRMHFRSFRIQSERYIGVLVEDLRPRSKRFRRD